jgi:hypothetical protein
VTTYTNAIGTLTTSDATLYTAAANGAVIPAGSFSNVTAAAHTVTLKVNRGGTIKYLLNAATVPANGSLTTAPELKPIVLRAGDILLGAADANTSVDFFLSIAEL